MAMATPSDVSDVRSRLRNALLNDEQQERHGA